MKANSLIPLVVIALAFGLIGCGSGSGGNGGSGGGNPSPQVAISITPTTATVSSGGQQQFTVTVAGPTNQSYTASTTAGTFSTTSGIYTAPTTSSNMSATITVTAQADTTKSAQAMVTVTAPPPPPPTTTSAVSTMTNSPFIWLANFGATTVALSGSGFAQIDTQMDSEGTPFATRRFVSANQWILGLGFDTNNFRTGFHTLSDCNTSGCSNPPAAYTFLADGLPKLGMGGDGRFIQVDRNAQLYSATQNPIGSPFSVGNGAGSVAFDSINNVAAIAHANCGPVCLYDLTDPAHKFGAANVSGSVKGIAQSNGTGCVAQPTEGVVTIFPMDLTKFTSVSSPGGAAGTAPWSVDMAQIGTDLECVSISTDLKLTRFSTVDGSLKGSLAITGLTSGGTPRVVTFNSGSATGTAAVLSPTDNIIVFVTLSTMMEIRRVTVAPSATSHVAQIMADETAGNLIIVIANVNGGTTTSGFAKLVIASGNPVPYTGPNSTAILLFMDVAVSPVSPNIIGGSFGQNAAIPVQ